MAFGVLIALEERWLRESSQLPFEKPLSPDQHRFESVFCGQTYSSLCLCEDVILVNVQIVSYAE